MVFPAAGVLGLAGIGAAPPGIGGGGVPGFGGLNTSSATSGVHGPVSLNLSRSSSPNSTQFIVAGVALVAIVFLLRK